MSAAIPSTPRLAAYGLLGLPLAMAALPIYVHVPRFYAEVVGVPLATLGGLLVAARALDALQDPLLGWWSDRVRARRGHRWPFVAFGAALTAAGVAGLFHPPGGGAGMQAAWLLANLVLVYTAYSLASVSYLAHGAEISDDPTQRTRVVAWREGFALAGVMLAAVLPAVLGYTRYALAFAPLIVVAAAVAIAGSPPAPARTGAAPPSWRRMLSPFGNRHFRWLLAANFASAVAAAVPATLVLFYVDDVIRRPDLAGAFLATYFGAGAAGLPLWTRLSRRVGKARAWVVGMAMAVVAFVGASTLAAGDAAAFLAVCALSGLALGADLALPASMLADAIDHDAARGLDRHEGAYFGLWNLASKLALAVGAGVALPLLAALGYRAGDPGGASTLAMVYAALPCVLKIAAAAVLLASPLIPKGASR